MSELHCDSHNKGLGLRVRVKLVNLDNTVKVSSAERVSTERLASIVGIGSDRTSHSWIGETSAEKSAVPVEGEICMHSGERVPFEEFELHIENCTVCANRVELQLDFIQTVEGAVFQRYCDPDSERIHGALLIGAPKLNFAVCGEIEFN